MNRSVLAAAVALLCAAPDTRKPAEYTTWEVHGGGPDGIRYSALDQINRSNVQRLERVWSYDTGDAFDGSEMQCNPIVVNGVLYATSPKLRVIALDAATGRVRWTFDPHEGKSYTRKARNRGVTYWTDGKQGRIFFALRHVLFALDAASGKLVKEFGDNGTVDLRQGLGRDPDSLNISLTTPGVLHNDLLIVGGSTGEDLPSAPGDVRAYDVRSGELRWSFHTIPHPGEFGYDTWPEDAWKRSGSANNWAGMAVDQERGMVFVPTGSAAFDFYGADRHGDNLFANSLIALNAETGKRLWHFQFVKHDVWDRDLPSAPNLVTIRRNGRTVDAVAQITKSGHVFVFERETGKPLYPMQTVKAPPSNIPGEKLAETQVLPLKPPPFARQEFTEAMVTRRTPEAHKAMLEQFRKLHSGPQFTPPSFEGTVIFPGYDGGGEWGGAAFDPTTGLLYVNSNEMPWILRLVDRKRTGRRTTGKALYEASCGNCHRADMKGSPPEFPSLVTIAKRRTHAEIKTVIRKGAGRMPPFPNLTAEAVEAISAYIETRESKEIETARISAGPFLPYTHDGYNKFLDPDGYPAVEPPWGTLCAIDLNKGEIAWQIPLGEFPELAAKGLKNTGSENYGGPAVTAGGIVFIGATNHDRKFRAFDKSKGKLLWETTLPASGNATPAVYEVNGRQFVAIAAGGGKSNRPSGGSYVAFALPEK